MRLAFCLFKYFPFGGLQRDFLKIAHACASRGHEVDVYTGSWEGDKIPQLNVTLLPVCGMQNYQKQKSFYNLLQKKLKNLQYDCVIGFNKMPQLDIYYAADTCLKRKMLTRSALLKFIPRYKHLLQFEESVFASNVKTKILMLAHQQIHDFQTCYQLSHDRYKLLPPGIDRNILDSTDANSIRATIRRECDIQSDDERVLLMVGSGFKTKGLDRVILGIAALPENIKTKTTLWIVGQDNAQSFLKFAKKLNVSKHIRFFGGRNDVKRFYLGADLLVHPAYYENTGTVLLEAMATGLPVLTTDICGYSSYITQAGAGEVIASPYSHEKFNAKMYALIKAGRQSTYSDNGMRFAKNADIFDLTAHAVHYIENYKKVPCYI